MTQQLDGIGDLGSRSFQSSLSTLTSNQHPECPDNRPQTGSTNDTSPTLGATIDELTTSDIIIAVMGSTGAGKSTFINMASGTQQATVGHRLNSCTQNVQQISYVDEGRGVRIVLVDTPGFDDTNVTDLEVLRRIAEWLKETHGQGILLSGILIFHRISDNRMGGTPLGAMKMFQDLCGKDALSNVMLVTTMWDEVDPDLGQQHEEELRGYWQPMLAQGARMLRFRHSEASAHAIVSHFQGCRRSLLIQDQMKKGSSWYETSAATRLFGPLAQLIRKILSMIHWLDHRIRKEKNPVKRSELAKRKERRESSLFEIIDTPQLLPSGSSLQRRASAPLIPPARRRPQLKTATLPGPVLGDPLQDSPAPLRISDLRRTAASCPSSARSHDSLEDQVEELTRLYRQIPVSMQDAISQMLSIIGNTRQLCPSDDSVVPLVGRAGSITIALAESAEEQPSIDNVKHAVDQFQAVLTETLDQLQVVLLKRRRPRQPATHVPDTLPCATKTADVLQSPSTSGGSDTPNNIQRVLESLHRIEAHLHNNQAPDINIHGGHFFNIQGDFRALPYPSSPDPMCETVHIPPTQPEYRHSPSPSPDL